MTKPLSTQLCVVVALDLEAKPLAAAWDLKRQQSGPFALYEGELSELDAPVCLLVAGIGRVSAAAGTAWLAAESSALEKPTVWINYGIAGASLVERRTAEIGDVVIAARVIDEEARRRISRHAAGPDGAAKKAPRVPTWYPPWLLGKGGRELGRSKVRRATVRTVDQPEREYADEGVYEMEAAGFFATAGRFASSEFVQAVKVVSDTPSSGVDQLDRSKIAECAERGVGAVSALSAGLLKLSEADTVELDPALAEASRARCGELGLTVAQNHLWRRQVERLEALIGAEAGIEALETLQATHRKRALVELTALVDGLATGNAKVAMAVAER